MQHTVNYPQPTSTEKVTHQPNTWMRVNVSMNTLKRIKKTPINDVGGFRTRNRVVSN